MIAAMLSMPEAAIVQFLIILSLPVIATEARWQR